MLRADDCSLILSSGREFLFLCHHIWTSSGVH